jgi:hypothetical protein
MTADELASAAERLARRYEIEEEPAVGAERFMNPLEGAQQIGWPQEMV